MGDQPEAKLALAGLADRFGLKGAERTKITLGFCHRGKVYCHWVNKIAVLPRESS